MASADDVLNYEQGTTGDPNNPYVLGWFSRIRARKVLSDNVNKLPFTRVWGTAKAVASPMNQDKVTAIADAVGWRTVNPETPAIVPEVTDVGDMIQIGWEVLKLIVPPAILAQAVANAKKFNKWPSDYTGVADFEKGT